MNVIEQEEINELIEEKRQNQKEAIKLYMRQTEKDEERAEKSNRIVKEIIHMTVEEFGKSIYYKNLDF